MHIHPNNSLLLASIAAGREDVQQIQAKRAAEVRRKLSSAARGFEASEGEDFRSATRVEAAAYRSDPLSSDNEGLGDDFGRLLSVKV